MNIPNVVERVMEIDQPVCPVLYRSFVQSEFSLLIVRRMNNFLQQHPEMRDAVYIAMTYPAIKWMLDNKESGEALLRLLGDNESAAMFNMTKSVAEKIAEEPLAELIERRRSYYEHCRMLAVGVEETVNVIGTYPEHGKKYRAVLNAALGIDRDSEKELSRYNINKYLPKALELLYRCMTEQSVVVNKVLTGVLPSDESNTVMHQGMLQTLQEYTQLLWLFKNSKKGNEVAVEKYLDFIDQAIERVKAFPAGGDVYYNIIQTIVRLKPLGIPDETAAERLGMSTYTFSIKKHRALLVLCSAMFCCEGDIYVKLLTDKV